MSVEHQNYIIYTYDRIRRRSPVNLQVSRGITFTSKFQAKAPGASIVQKPINIVTNYEVNEDNITGVYDQYRPYEREIKKIKAIRATYCPIANGKFELGLFSWNHHWKSYCL